METINEGTSDLKIRIIKTKPNWRSLSIKSQGRIQVLTINNIRGIEEIMLSLQMNILEALESSPNIN